MPRPRKRAWSTPATAAEGGEGQRRDACAIGTECSRASFAAQKRHRLPQDQSHHGTRAQAQRALLLSLTWVPFRSGGRDGSGPRSGARHGCRAFPTAQGCAVGKPRPRHEPALSAGARTGCAFFGLPFFAQAKKGRSPKAKAFRIASKKPRSKDTGPLPTQGRRASESPLYGSSPRPSCSPRSSAYATTTNRASKPRVPCPQHLPHSLPDTHGAEHPTPAIGWPCTPG